MDYKFEEVQKLKFALYDIDSPNQRLTDHDFLGEMECTLGHVSAYKHMQCNIVFLLLLLLFWVIILLILIIIWVLVTLLTTPLC